MISLTQLIRTVQLAKCSVAFHGNSALQELRDICEKLQQDQCFACIIISTPKAPKGNFSLLVNMDILDVGVRAGRRISRRGDCFGHAFSLNLCGVYMQEVYLEVHLGPHVQGS